MSQRVFVTGGSGFVGRAVIEALASRGDRVTLLTRSKERASGLGASSVQVVEGDPTGPGAWQRELANHDAVIHLVGQPVGAKRWNAHYKQIINDSRVESTRYVVEGIEALEPSVRPGVLLSASGIDYYGFSDDLGLELEDDDEIDEQAPQGGSFLARVCRNWESEAQAAQEYAVRVVCMRLGVVLGQAAGPLASIVKPFKWLVGGRLGTGRQWFSWIHLTDVVGAMLFCLDTAGVTGGVNFVAPKPVRNREFSRELARVLRRPSWLPVPSRVLNLAVGEFAEFLLNGRRAVPKVLVDSGYQFAFPQLTSALENLLE